ncbi:hypothetical protein UFOVP359_115 [uncultured Caudovirales phage]|uniref:Uncharacterized protein n=1 Tax=uncultured Caudovirales phage TaxID=2100421 RepID=A0A6J7WVX2_9CAUD|nr:hypothetical protein UFOVP359_115 [uncultured Caudovirales phage]
MGLNKLNHIYKEPFILDTLRVDNDVAIADQLAVSAIIQNLTIKDLTVTGDLTAGVTNISGDDKNNIKVGENALSFVTTGIQNTAFGRNTLFSNNTGSNNIAIGDTALNENASGSDSIAIGQNTLKSSNASGGTAIGSKALELSTGANNTAIGFNAGLINTNGASNTFLGALAGSAVTSGSKNVIIGANTGSSIATSSNNIIISDGDGNSRISVNSTGVVSIPGSVSVTGTAIYHIETNTPTLSAGNSYTYTLVLADDGKFVDMNTTTGITNYINVPLNSSVAFPVGTQINIVQTGVGQTVIRDSTNGGISGVTVNATPGKKLRATWSVATLVKRSTNDWLLMGDLTV